MLGYIRDWFQRRFSDPNAVTLTLLLLIGFGLIIFFGTVLAPILVAIALAYLLEWPVNRLQRFGFKRLYAVFLVFTFFLAFFFASIVFLVPVIWQQSVNLLAELPQIAQAWREMMESVEDVAPAFIDASQLQLFTDKVNDRLLTLGQTILERSWNTLMLLAVLLVYTIIVPLLVFFMLKDKDLLLNHFNRILPEQRRLISQVGTEMNLQIMNYIRGKALEIIIVGLAAYATFYFFDLRYAALLATLVGFSVLVPYIGAAVVTIPIALVGLFQFGLSMTLFWLIFAYGILQALDGNVLVPILFSEAVALHPVYIIAAVLIFGAIWGFWGVFFAIPLASLVKAVITALSSHKEEIA